MSDGSSLVIAENIYNLKNDLKRKWTLYVRTPDPAGQPDYELITYLNEAQAKALHRTGVSWDGKSMDTTVKEDKSKYYPKDLSGKIKHSVEELLESALAILKAERFGLDKIYDSQTNRQHILNELQDVRRVIGIIEEELDKPATDPIPVKFSEEDLDKILDKVKGMLQNGNIVNTLTYTKTCNICNQTDSCINEGICHYTGSTLSETR